MAGLFSRREFCGRTGTALAALAFSPACVLDGEGLQQRSDGRLKTQLPAKRKETGGSRPPGQGTEKGAREPLGLGGARDGVLFLPSRTDASPMPLLVLLHGAGGRGESMLNRFGDIPGESRVAVLAPDSRGSTWDAIRGGFGADVEFLDRALARVFSAAAIDPARVAVGGFSDGASYALSLGLINGDFFSKIAAFSPGFVVPGQLHGKARVFVSHGTADPILPIDRCSRVIVPQLLRAQYDVTFREFAGGHEVPKEIATEAFAWIAR